ncbi:winged helix-turn-helix transcriptional regulator [Methanosarcina sp. KYL-1]|nr:winged helix-turn-helix transcriptional regulator [Methanosarcina sp. KYL-1]
MSDEDAEKLFLQEKPTLALLFIGSKEKTYASVISKEIDSTFAHTTRILSKMEQCGLIRFTFEGRIKFVELTEYGRKVEAALKEFRDIIGDEKEALKEEEPGRSGEGEFSELRENPDEGEGSEPEKELDPVNSELLDKIRNFRSRIEHIHREAVGQGESRDTISRKLGPYSRDIKKLRNQVDTAESPIDETVNEALEESAGLLESYLKG